jgi:hypothetical protein
VLNAITTPEEPTMQTVESIAIRRATQSDRPVVERLATLDSAPAPSSGEVLIAYVGDEPQAAVDVATGAAVADPFRPTAHVVELLKVRAATMRDRPSSYGRTGLRERLAYRAA